MGVCAEHRRVCSGPRVPTRAQTPFEGVSTVRYDLTVSTDGSDVVCHIGWTVRDASGDAVAVGTWMGDVLAVYTPEGALLAALAEARAADQQLNLLPADGEY